MRIEEVAIGAVLHSGTLTAVTRHGTALSLAEEQPAGSPEAAATTLLRMKAELRRSRPCEPVIFLDADHVAGRVLDLILQHDRHSADQIVHGLSPAHAFAPGGVAFADRRSELLHAFLSALHAAKLLVPPDQELTSQLLAFEERERGGKIAYPSPADVAERVGRFPARAIAAVLSAIPAPPPGRVLPGAYTLGPNHPDNPVRRRREMADWDPYADI